MLECVDFEVRAATFEVERLIEVIINECANRQKDVRLREGQDGLEVGIR